MEWRESVKQDSSNMDCKTEFSLPEMNTWMMFSLLPLSISSSNRPPTVAYFATSFNSLTAHVSFDIVCVTCLSYSPYFLMPLFLSFWIFVSNQRTKFSFGNGFKQLANFDELSSSPSPCLQRLVRFHTNAHAHVLKKKNSYIMNRRDFDGFITFYFIVYIFFPSIYFTLFRSNEILNNFGGMCRQSVCIH